MLMSLVVCKPVKQSGEHVFHGKHCAFGINELPGGQRPSKADATERDGIKKMMWFRKETNTTDANKIHRLVVVRYPCERGQDRLSLRDGRHDTWMNAKPYVLIDFFPLPPVMCVRVTKKSCG